MEENNRKGPGVFYAVVGVATLIVAIIGATFAYFSATIESDTETVTGQTATAATVSLAVEQVYPTLESGKQGIGGRMIPLTDSDLATAVSAANSCIDKNGYVACQVYQVTLTNEEGSDTVMANVSVQLTTLDGIENMRWQRLTDVNTVDAEFDAVEDHSEAVVLGDDLTLTGSKTVDEEGNKNTVVEYFVVWLHNTTDAVEGDNSGNQTETDAGRLFKGTVSASMLDLEGNPVGKLQATFAA